MRISTRRGRATCSRFIRPGCSSRLGLGLEEWARDLVNESNNSNLIKAQASYQIPLMDVPQGKVDYSFGDIHPYGNPHYQLDPEDGRIMAHNISMRSRMPIPADKEYFAQNLAAFDERLSAAEQKWRAAMAPFAGDKFIPYHESWSYFARAFKLSTPTTVESKPGFVPSPARIEEVIEICKAARETDRHRAVLRRVDREAGGRTGRDSLSGP